MRTRGAAVALILVALAWAVSPALGSVAALAAAAEVGRGFLTARFKVIRILGGSDR